MVGMQSGRGNKMEMKRKRHALLLRSSKVVATRTLQALDLILAAPRQDSVSQAMMRDHANFPHLMLMRRLKSVAFPHRHTAGRGKVSENAGLCSSQRRKRGNCGTHPAQAPRTSASPSLCQPQSPYVRMARRSASTVRIRLRRSVRRCRIFGGRIRRSPGRVAG
jgi:hypothetical protein